MKTFATTTSIRGTPEAIWKLLVDAPGWPAWNPTVTRVDGRIAPGETLTIHARISPGRAFPVKVTEFEANKRMVFSGGMPLGLFKGERTYTLTPKDGATEFDMREVYTGLLSPLIVRTIPDLQPEFDAFAAALKTRIETP